MALPKEFMSLDNTKKNTSKPETISQVKIRVQNPLGTGTLLASRVEA